MSQLTLSFVPKVNVPIDRDVLHRGAKCFPYQQAPPAPPGLEQAVWAKALDVAEDLIRWRRATEVPADLTRRPHDAVGGSGGMDHGNFGIHIGYPVRHKLSWATLLDALQARAHNEPEVAEARDLAHAYHALDYYGRVYGPDSLLNQPGYAYMRRPDDEHRARELMRRLAAACLELDGTPQLLSLHTDYMRAGINEALATAGHAPIAKADNN